MTYYTYTILPLQRLYCKRFMRTALNIILCLFTSTVVHAQQHTTKDDGLKGKVKKVTATSLLQREGKGQKFHGITVDDYDVKGIKTRNKYTFIAIDRKDTLYTRTISYTFKNGLPDTYELIERNKRGIVQQTFSKYYYNMQGKSGREEGYTITGGKKRFEKTVHKQYDSLMITQKYVGPQAADLKLVEIDSNKYTRAGKTVNTDTYTFSATDDTGAGEFLFSGHNTYIDSAGYELYDYFDTDSVHSGVVFKTLEDGRAYNITRYTYSDEIHYEHSFHDIDKQGNYLRITETSPDSKEVITYKIEYYQ